MRQRDIEANLNKEVFITGAGDLYFDYEVRPVINQWAKLLRVARGGLIEVELEGKKYYVPQRNLLTKEEHEAFKNFKGT